MSCEFTDSIVMEVLGKTVSFANIDHLTMEVLGKYQVGTIDINHMIMETLGKTASFANFDHVVMEVIGQWDGCPSCN